METLSVERQGGRVAIRMNRPEVRNAFNATLIGDLRDVFLSLKPSDRVVVLSGAGKVFSAGADLAWMKEAAALGEAGNAREARQLASLFEAVDKAPVPVVARVQGAALGGGMGLVACCDIVVAEAGARFGFTEARLGLAPAVISPFVIRKVGESAARRYFVTAELFDGREAHRLNLVHEVCEAHELDEVVEARVAAVLQCGPTATRESKRLALEVSRGRDDVDEFTAAMIASLRVSQEGQEGLAAFLEKRRASWVEGGQ